MPEIPETKIDPTTLVALLAATARVDTSNPPAWRTDFLLQALERFMFGRRDFAGFTLVVHETQALLDGKDEDRATQVLLHIARANGERRTDGVEPGLVMARLADANFVVGSLPPGARRNRLEELVRYHTAAVAGKDGYYAEAALAHQEIAARDPNPATTAISRFAAQFNRVRDLVTRANYRDTSALELAIANLHWYLGALQAAVKGTAHELQWGHGNGPVNLLQVMFLAKCSGQGRLWDEIIMVLATHSAELGGAFLPMIAALDAADAQRRGAPLGQVIHAAHEVTMTKLGEDKVAMAFATLAIARAAAETGDAGDLAEAKAHYALIQPGPELHDIAAVAARELAALGK